MTKYPESVLTKNKKGETEVRVLLARGQFILYDYRSPSGLKPMENGKRKLYLKDSDGNAEEYYIIPTSTGRELLIKSKKADTNEKRFVWNGKKSKEESLWK